MKFKINPSIFRSYDIRGIYPSEVNKKTAYEIGQAFARLTGAKKVLVGRDTRLSSPVLSKFLIKGLADQGADVYDIGKIPTECIYFSVGKYNCGGGITVTASHNPKNYNGFKMVKKNGKMVEVVSGKSLRGAIEKKGPVRQKKRGKVEKKDIWHDFVRHVFSFISVKKIKPFKVVVDTGNGMAGKVISLLSSKLPVKIIPLNFKMDGSFPVHSPNPLEKGVTDQIKKEILKKKADFGFIFDGDADRIFLVDELGKLVKGDTTLLLLAKHFLEKEPGKGVAYNAVCSKAVPEFVKKWGGRPIRTKVGFINVRDGLVKNDGVVSGEVSGHFGFKGNHYLDSGFIAFLVLLQIISQADKKVSEITSFLTPYSKSDEVNFKVKDKEKILERLKKKYHDGKQDFLDGVTVQYKDWWFNARPSQTEPLLRLVVEADNVKLMREKKKELADFIRKNN